MLSDSEAELAAPHMNRASALDTEAPEGFNVNARSDSWVLTSPEGNRS